MFDEAGHNFISELNHASTSFTLTPKQVGINHASQLEEIRVTGLIRMCVMELFHLISSGKC